jgi:tRNA(Ile)-lysidine synthetase-like protein
MAGMVKLIKPLLNHSDTYFFALSMGVDSVAAFTYLHKRKYNVVPVHYNHKLRSQNDDMERAFRDFCAHLNTDYVVGTRPNENQPKTEAQCRDLRIGFFNSISSGHTIITAHHLNDWVESYLMNCLRGHPSQEPFKLLENFGSRFTIMHPFLLSRKRDLLQYAERMGLMRFVVADETNDVVKGSRRNWLRNVIIPELEKNELRLEKYGLKRIEKLINRCILKIN